MAMNQLHETVLGKSVSAAVGILGAYLIYLVLFL